MNRGYGLLGILVMTPMHVYAGNVTSRQIEDRPSVHAVVLNFSDDRAIDLEEDRSSTDNEDNLVVDGDDDSDYFSEDSWDLPDFIQSHFDDTSLSHTSNLSHHSAVGSEPWIIVTHTLVNENFDDVFSASDNDDSSCSESFDTML